MIDKFIGAVVFVLAVWLVTQLISPPLQLVLDNRNIELRKENVKLKAKIQAKIDKLTAERDKAYHERNDCWAQTYPHFRIEVKDEN